MRTIVLNDDFCTIPKPYKIERISNIKLIQKPEVQSLQYQACYIIANYLITKCSSLDDAKVVLIIQIGSAAYSEANKKLSPYICIRFHHNLKINQII